MSTKVKRKLFVTFLNINPGGTASYVVIGDGVPDLSIDYGPKILEETYITDSMATQAVESYVGKMEVDATAKYGDSAYNFIANLGETLAILDSAETDICQVYEYKAGGPTSYPAINQPVAIAVNKFGGKGGEPARIGYTIYSKGNPTSGSFNATSLIYTSNLQL